ncbi:dTDP-glucose 4,6-dehydratase [Rickettsiales bacterium]|nr:dTDP-glucose 4,6-dehydratase [Rickettsiales bacterium]
MIQPKNLLVTGAAGFIGSIFVHQAVQRGQNVIVLDALTYAGRRGNLSWIEGKGSYELIIGNICDTALVKKILFDNKIDAVVNFAAESHVDRSIESSRIFIETNVMGTHSMLEASREYWDSLSPRKKDEFRYVQISTDEVYGSLSLGSGDKFSETSLMRPNSPYSASKAAADHLVRAWFETYDLPTIATNCSNNYGARQHEEKLIPKMIMRAIRGESLTIHGDGKNVRDWIHTHDHCEGIYLALTKGRPGRTYCFGGNAERSNIEVVKQICYILDDLRPRKDGRSYIELITFVPDRKGNDRRYAIDDNRAEKELGFKRKYDFESGLVETIKWYMKNENWSQMLDEEKAMEDSNSDMEVA